MKSLYRVVKFIFSRTAVCIFGILLQVLYIGMLFWTLGTLFFYSYFVFSFIGFMVSIYIINSGINQSYKLIWVFAVLSFPIFGCMFYWFYGYRTSRKSTLLTEEYSSYLYDDNEVYDILLNTDECVAKQANYIRRYGKLPIYNNTQTRYYPNGESIFPAILNELERAERFIYLEYFIIQEGLMWNSILEILERKANDGVDVRVIYDDIGCLLTLPRNYFQVLNRKGIKACSYGRLKPFWSPKINNRDHRKMLIIDGRTAFTGGINLADEYINQYKKHGYWKDSALFMSGDAVNSFTVMFLSLWNRINVCNIEVPLSYSSAIKAQGFAIPYMDSPSDNEMLGENVYINVINNARRYVYITTPYLILDNEMKTALILAAKNGIDVRIITPHIADKKFVHAVTRSNYKELITNGIRIFEFLPGFIHAKSFVSDDSISVVGTINLDFRSLYLHYECGVWMYDTPAVYDVKKDFMDTLEQCKEITQVECTKQNLVKRIGCALIRLFSPLM